MDPSTLTRIPYGVTLHLRRKWRKWISWGRGTRGKLRALCVAVILSGARLYVHRTVKVDSSEGIRKDKASWVRDGLCRVRKEQDSHEGPLCRRKVHFRTETHYLRVNNWGNGLIRWKFPTQVGLRYRRKTWKLPCFCGFHRQIHALEQHLGRERELNRDLLRTEDNTGKLTWVPGFFQQKWPNWARCEDKHLGWLGSLLGIFFKRRTILIMFRLL